MHKIMAVFGDGHPDTLVDLVADGLQFEALESFKDYLYHNPYNVEGYINFYSEEL